MIIESIFPPHLYSIRYDSEEINEFDRLLDNWNDAVYVTEFLRANSDYLSTPVWSQTPTPEDAARQVYNEARVIEEYFEELAQNSYQGIIPNFNSIFHYLDGKYKYELKIPPMKSYGHVRPSLIRIYAIKLGDNCYLITGGGIKLSDTIQNSPNLKDHVLQNIDKVRNYLLENGISDSLDI